MKQEPIAAEILGQYREIFLHTRDLILILSPGGQLRFANAAFLRALGYDEKDIPGLMVNDILHEQSREKCLAQFQRVVSGEKVESVTVFFQARSGSVLAAEGNCYCRMEKGKVTEVLGIFRGTGGRAEQMAKEFQRNAALAEIELAINQPHELQQVLNRIVRATEQFLPSSGASVILWDANKEQFFVSASTIPGQNPQMAKQRVRRNRGATRWIVDHGRPHIVMDIRHDPFGANAMLPEFNLQAYAGVPLLCDGKALGVLYALDREPRNYSDEDLNFLTALATRAAAAVSKVRLYEQLKTANRLLAEQREAMEKFANEEKIFSEALLNSFPGIFYVLDERGRFLRWNRRSEEISGYSSEELAGMDPIDLVVKEEQALAREQMAKGFASGRMDVEVTAQTKDGRRIPFYFTGWRIRFEGKTCLIGAGIDITARKQLEQKVAESASRLRTIIESEPECVKLLARNGTVLQMNPAGLAMIEADSEAIVFGKNVSAIVQPEYRAAFNQLTKKVFKGQSGSLEFEIVGLKGTRRWLETHAVPLRDESGEITALLGITRDISARKKAEEALGHLSARLLVLQEQEHQRIARELHDTTAQDLAAIITNLSVVSRRLDKPDATARKFLEDSFTLARKASREIRTMSYLLHPPLLKEIGLIATIRDYARGFSQRSGIRVSVRCPENFGRLPDEIETALFRIVQESLGNVLRHSASKSARIQMRREKSRVVLAVRDCGRGIPEKKLKALVESSAVLGVGIAGMRERLRQLYGALEIKSGDAGTTIRAIVPLRKGKP